MESLNGLIIGVIVISLFEIVVLLWFNMKRIDLKQGKPYFKISKMIPVLYVSLTLIMTLLIINQSLSLEIGDTVPLGSNENQALGFFIIANLATPLFPILEGMKRRKIEEIAQTTKENDE